MACGAVYAGTDEGRGTLGRRALTLSLGILLALCLARAGWADGEGPADGSLPAAASTVSEEGVPGNVDDPWDEFEDDPVEIADPLEPLNRGVFWVNDTLYFYLFKPVARGLRIVPEPVRISVSNFFRNLATPIRFVNSVFQGKGEDAGNELGRFLANTVLGVGGLFDPAKKMTGIGPKDEDFGQTLGYHGIGQGLYLVLPVLGPSSLRDGVGLVADAFLDPLYYLSAVGVDDGRTVAVAAKVVDREVWLSIDKDTYEGIKRDALDPYLFVRSAYTQRREAKVRE